MQVYIDLDGTVADFDSPLLKQINKIHNTNYTREDISFWGWFDDKIDISVINKKGYFANLKPLPGAIEFINDLKTIFPDFMFLTSISKDMTFAATEKMEWVEKNLHCDYKKVIICNDKPNVLSANDFLLDDKYETVYDAYFKKGKKNAFLFGQPWNRGNIIKSVNYQEFLFHVKFASL